ncbi:MAG: hypothetical protein J2P38_05735 [Candidatus Dormibacteraeota bacterium]|nr:hypothetical protein [Candidatus Dormibacteraeota bacterium]
MTLRLVRAGLALLVTLLEVVLAFRVLGVPDLGAAGAFLRGSVPTLPQSIAIAELIVWIVLAVASAVAVVATLREARRVVPEAAIRRGWSVAVVLCGAAILLAGVAHQLAPATIGLDGGGSVSQATRTLGP